MKTSVGATPWASHPHHEKSLKLIPRTNSKRSPPLPSPQESHSRSSKLPPQVDDSTSQQLKSARLLKPQLVQSRSWNSVQKTPTEDDVLLKRLEEETKAAASNKIMCLLLLWNFNQKHNLKKKHTHTNKHKGIDNNSRQARQATASWSKAPSYKTKLQTWKGVEEEGGEHQHQQRHWGIGERESKRAEAL